MPTLELAPAGSPGAYAWDEDTLDAIEQASDADPPAEEAYLHFQGRALGQLPWSFRHKPVIEGFLATLAAEVTTLDTDAWALLQARWVDTAVGAQLLPLGRYVGAPVQAQFEDDLNRNLIDLWAQLAVADRTWANSSTYLWGQLFQEARLHATPGDWTMWISLNNANDGLALALTDGLWATAIADLAVPHIFPAGFIHGEIDYSLDEGLYFDEGSFGTETLFDTVLL